MNKDPLSIEELIKQAESQVKRLRFERHKKRLKEVDNETG